MEQVVLRHLSGSKAKQIETFPLGGFRDVLIGRDPAAGVRYDPEQDDLVGRQHARLSREAGESHRFTITDLHSRNGTFVNKQRITGTAAVTPGDVVQLGPGGPEFEFTLDPLPVQFARTARPVPAPAAPPSIEGAQPAPGLRSEQAAGAAATLEQSATVEVEWRVTEPAMTPPRADARAASVEAPTAPADTFGTATIERKVADARRRGRRVAVVASAAAAVLALAVGGFLWYRSTAVGRQPEAGSKQAAGFRMSATEIARRFSPSTVFLEVGWKLTYQPTGAPVFHEYYVEKSDSGQPVRQDADLVTTPIYVQFPDGKIEPSLALDKGPFGENQPIGGRHAGSGFVVTADGFILTNRHMAAAWTTAYRFPAGPALLLHLDSRRGERVDAPPADWVPADARVIGRKEVPHEAVLGRLDYLDVTFAASRLRVPATLARVSDRHDVAMLKVDLSRPLGKVELYDDYDTATPGSTVTILGYHGLSSLGLALGRSPDRVDSDLERRTVPDPSVMPGTVGRVIRGQPGAGAARPYDDLSEWDDSYQLTVNPPGAGASGGPVFDDRGRVIAVFTAGRAGPGDTGVCFATPIRYGIQLMQVTSAGPTR